MNKQKFQKGKYLMSNHILVLGANQIKSALNAKESEITEIVKNTYLLHHLGKTSLPHSIFLRFPDNEKNRIIGLPAYIGGNENIAGLKWISSFPENIEHNIERASAAIFLNEMSTGRVKAVLEGSIISSKRTAASAALAARHLHANYDENTIGLVGCGRINQEILLFVSNIFQNISKVYLYDLSDKRMEHFISWHQNTKFTFEKCQNIEQLFTKTKLVSFATTAGVPFLEKIDAITPEHTVLGISLRDLAPSIIEKSYNIVDDFEHVCRERTSIHLTYQKLNRRDFVAGSIADVLNKKIAARENDKPVIFSPFGLGVLDLSLANYIYQSAIQNHSGTVVENFLP